MKRSWSDVWSSGKDHFFVLRLLVGEGTHNCIGKWWLSSGFGTMWCNEFTGVPFARLYAALLLVFFSFCNFGSFKKREKSKEKV